MKVRRYLRRCSTHMAQCQTIDYYGQTGSLQYMHACRHTYKHIILFVYVDRFIYVYLFICLFIVNV